MSLLETHAPALAAINVESTLTRHQQMYRDRVLTFAEERLQKRLDALNRGSQRNDRPYEVISEVERRILLDRLTPLLHRAAQDLVTKEKGRIIGIYSIGDKKEKANSVNSSVSRDATALVEQLPYDQIIYEVLYPDWPVQSLGLSPERQLAFMRLVPRVERRIQDRLRSLSSDGSFSQDEVDGLLNEAYPVILEYAQKLNLEGGTPAEADAIKRIEDRLRLSAASWKERYPELLDEFGEVDPKSRTGLALSIAHRSVYKSKAYQSGQPRELWMEALRRSLRRMRLVDERLPAELSTQSARESAARLFQALFSMDEWLGAELVDRLVQEESATVLDGMAAHWAGYLVQTLSSFSLVAKSQDWDEHRTEEARRLYLRHHFKLFLTQARQGFYSVNRVGAIVPWSDQLFEELFGHGVERSGPSRAQLERERLYQERRARLFRFSSVEYLFGEDIAEPNNLRKSMLYRFLSLREAELKQLPEEWQNLHASLGEVGRKNLDILLGHLVFQFLEVENRDAEVSIQQFHQWLLRPQILSSLQMIRQLLSLEDNWLYSKVDAIERTRLIWSWIAQASNFEGAPEHALADRPHLETLSLLLPHTSTTNREEQAMFLLAVPRLSRWIHLRASYAAQGSTEIYERIRLQLIAESIPHYKEEVKNAVLRARQKRSRGEPRTSPDALRVQLMTPVKSNSKILPGELIAMTLPDQHGRSLVDNVRNIVMSVDGSRFDRGSLARYVPFSERTKFLGHTEQERREALNSLIYHQLVHHIIYSPFAVDAGRAEGAYRSHYADRVAEGVEREIQRLAEEDWTTSRREGLSLDAPVGDTSEPGGERINFMTSPGVSAPAELASNERLRLLLEVPVEQYSLLFTYDEAKAVMILRSMTDQNLEAQGTLSGPYKRLVTDALSALEKMGAWAHRTENSSEMLAQMLVARTHSSVGDERLYSSALEYVNFLTPVERGKLVRILREGESADTATNEIIDVWLSVVEGLLQHTGAMAASVRFAGPRVYPLTTREARRFAELLRVTDSGFVESLVAQSKAGLLSMEDRLWIGLLSNESAATIFSSLESVEAERIERRLEALIRKDSPGATFHRFWR